MMQDLPEHQSSNLCKFFNPFFGSGCRFGSSCKFVHQNSENCVNRNPSAEISNINPNAIFDRRSKSRCVFFHQAGGCQKGSSCKFIHSDAPSDSLTSGDAPVYGPGDKAEVHQCVICLGDISHYGLLINCDHVFCIPCISDWRKDAKEKSSNDDELAAKRSCPICRAHSDYVLTSSRYISGEEKALLVEKKKNDKSRIPCKMFKLDNKATSCKFGGHCFYAHLDENGDDLKPKQLKKKRLHDDWRLMRRHMLYGDVEDLFPSAEAWREFAIRTLFVQPGEEDSDDSVW